MEVPLETEVVGDVRIFRMPADMPADFSQRDPFRKAFGQAVLESPQKKLILNLREAPFYDSMSLGLLVATQKQLRDRGYSIVFCNVGKQTLWALQATQLDKVLDVFDDEAAALKQAAG